MFWSIPRNARFWPVRDQGLFGPIGRQPAVVHQPIATLCDLWDATNDLKQGRPRASVPPPATGVVDCRRLSQPRCRLKGLLSENVGFVDLVTARKPGNAVDCFQHPPLLRHMSCASE